VWHTIQKFGLGDIVELLPNLTRIPNYAMLQIWQWQHCEALAELSKKEVP
jgi:hypothetical protein